MPTARTLSSAENINHESTHTAPAEKHFQIKPNPEATTSTIIEEHSPDPVAPGKAFYREKQKNSSGLCGMHALNAFCGGPVIDNNEFLDRYSSIYSSAYQYGAGRIPEPDWR